MRYNYPHIIENCVGEKLNPLGTTVLKLKSTMDTYECGSNAVYTNNDAPRLFAETYFNYVLSTPPTSHRELQS